MNKLLEWLRDKKRGYTQKDIVSVNRKLAEYNPRPGGIIPLTNAEFRAYRDELDKLNGVDKQ